MATKLILIASVWMLFNYDKAGRACTCKMVVGQGVELATTFKLHRAHSHGPPDMSAGKLPSA